MCRTYCEISFQRRTTRDNTCPPSLLPHYWQSIRPDSPSRILRISILKSPRNHHSLIPPLPLPPRDRPPNFFLLPLSRPDVADGELRSLAPFGSIEVDPCRFQVVGSDVGPQVEVLTRGRGCAFLGHGSILLLQEQGDVTMTRRSSSWVRGYEREDFLTSEKVVCLQEARQQS